MSVRRISVLLFLTFLSLAPFAQAASDVVISQVYGGGGNSGATYKNDYIELFNRGTVAVPLAGWSVQYASSTGSSWAVTPLSGSIGPGQYYLVQEAAGTGGTLALPAPVNATGSIAMSATTGKVALVASTAPLTGTCPAGAIDVVGFGGANCFEGAAPTPALANLTAALRNNSGCADSDSNSADFAVGPPAPRNSATAPKVCDSPNQPPSITAPANPIATVAQGASPFTVTLTGSDDGNLYQWSATTGSGVTSVALTAGEGSPNATFTVALSPTFSGTATFTAFLSDNVNAATTRTVNIAVTPTVANDAPSIAAFANPVATVAQDAAPFSISMAGSDDNGVYQWSATTGAGISAAAVTAGQGTANATFTITLQPGFSGTASFTAVLSDSVNPNVTRLVTITVTPAPPPALDHLVISQVYGGGGNSGATYRNDFVELYNPTTTAVDLTGWSIQYGSATGTTWQVQPLGGTMQAGEYYLISLASGGAIGATLPSANIDGDLNLSGTSGKVALSRAGDALSGCPIGDASLVDLVGFGTTANCREGGTNAAAPSNTTSVFRKNGGLTDTNVNGADFQSGTPNPRRTTPIQEIGPSVLSSDPRNGGTNAPRDASITVTFTEAVETEGAWFDVNCTTTGQHDSATVAVNANALIITPNASFQAGEQCTVTIFRQFVHDADLDDSAPNTNTLANNVTFTFTVASGAAPAYSPDVHLTFGNPSGAEADLLTPNDYLMIKPEYALSYNRDRGTPNWVSWHLADEWIGSLARFDTFRPDPAVPADWYRVLHTDYFASGFDRGHMVPNADRDPETSTPINQATFLMSNMIPQAPDNNQGPWADLENYLRTLLPANELYIVAGPAGVGGTGSSGFMTTFADGKITVPASTWKVALVLPKAAGDDIARVTAGARTIAVVMPNVQGIRNNDWTSYLTTVDAVEALTGYDFFANTADAIENAIEAGVNGANPPGVTDQNFSTDEDVAGSITLEAASASADLTYTIAGAPQHGTLSGTGANRTYTPALNYFGTDSFTFTVSDGTLSSKTATVSIKVVAVNDEPVAIDDVRGTNEDATLQFAAYQLTENDSAGPANESKQTLVVSSVAATADTHGTVTLRAGMIAYTPAADYNGPASFTYQVCDSGSLCATGTVNVDVVAINDAPVVSVFAPANGVEGSAIAATASVADADAGDSSSTAWTVAKNGAPFANGTGTSVAFTPDDNGSYVITVTATDAAGATGNSSKSITVANAAPVLAGVSGPSSQLALGTAAVVMVSFADAGAADTHTATFNWGDGSTATGACAAGVCSASRTYAAAGLYSVAIVVADDDGAIANASFDTVVIYDNAGGSITGGGFITTASGKANVVVNAQYLKGTATPTGNTKFDVAGSTLISTSYDWLVVTGTTAQIQGTSTINGAGAFGFLITATDNGANDTVRLRVWDKTTGATVYDTGAALAVSGGNITIH